MVDPIGGFGGFPGFGKYLSVDAGIGGPGGWGGGPYGGWGGVPYVPTTPLGGLWGIKGDLVVPIVAVGVAIFILIIIVLAVKAALGWKLAMMDKAMMGKKFVRAAGSPPEEDHLNTLANIVYSAITSQSCNQRIMCEIGAFAREQKEFPALIRMMEYVVPSYFSEPLSIVRSSAEGVIDCRSKYPCNDGDRNIPSVNIAQNATLNNQEDNSIRPKTPPQKPIPLVFQQKTA